MKHPYWGRPIAYKTWMGLWLDMMSYSIMEFSRMVYYSPTQIKRWRSGGRMGRHAAQLIRSRWPDAPVSLFGGTVPKIADRLPVNARTPQLYKFLFKRMNLVPEAKPIWAVAIERARGINVGGGLQAEQVPVPSGEINPDGV